MNDEELTELSDPVASSPVAPDLRGLLVTRADSAPTVLFKCTHDREGGDEEMLPPTAMPQWVAKQFANATKTLESWTDIKREAAGVNLTHNRARMSPSELRDAIVAFVRERGKATYAEIRAEFASEDVNRFNRESLRAMMAGDITLRDGGIVPREDMNRQIVQAMRSGEITIEAGVYTPREETK